MQILGTLLTNFVLELEGLLKKATSVFAPRLGVH
jgi:hypothetical protein